MGLLDFLKKQEFNEIKSLNLEIALIKGQHQKELDSLNQKLSKYQALIDIEKEVKEKKQELSQIEKTKNEEIRESEIAIKNTNLEYKTALDTYKKLRKELSIYQSKLDLIEFGVYEPVYDFEKSEDYREAQKQIINKQKDMLNADTAAICDTSWTVEGSEAKGRAVVKVYKKLMLRAFNGESDSLIAKVKWNNINQMKERIQKIFDSVNKLGEGFKVHISSRYLNLKEKELILEYEYQAKKQREKEEMRAIQEELREEEKARRDFEKAQKEAEKEESIFQKALEKAQKEFSNSDGKDSEKLRMQIIQLEKELIEIKEKKERALSMAQQTKRGYVYIISNIGAFGEDVYKIGMTRRLEPTDRVKELGDASVPFQFDIHAMIYSDEARTLEYELHKAFSEKKVNMLNYRKEFFKVTLDEIEDKIKDLGFEAQFTKLPEAMEYRETLNIIEKIGNKDLIKSLDEIISEEFPDSLED